LRTQEPNPAATVAASVDADAPEACEAVVAKRAKAGLLTMAVAICVAVLTLAGAAGTLLLTGFVPLPGLEDRITGAMESRLGEGWTVEAGTAELRRIDGRSQLQIRQVLFRHRSGASIRAPEATLGYDPLALLRGEIRLVSVDLRGVNVRLGVTREGALVVNADSAPAEIRPPSTLPDAAQWNAFTGLMGAVASLAQGEGLLGSLETAGMQGARLTLVDPDGRQRAGFEDVGISLSRQSARVTRLTMQGRTGPRWKELIIDLSADEAGTQRAEIEIVRFEPSEIVALAMGSGTVSLKGLPIKGRATLVQKADGQRSIAASIQIAAGEIAFPGGPLETLTIDAAAFEVSAENDLNLLRMTSGRIAAGGLDLSGQGTLREEQGAWRLQIDGSGQIAGAEGDPPVQVTGLEGNLLLDPRSNEIRIDRLALKGPGLDAGMTGVLQKIGPSPSQRLTIQAVDTDVRAALAAWPRWSSPDLHSELSRQLKSGRAERVTVELDLSAEDHARLMEGAGMPDAALAVSVTGRDVVYAPGPGLPLLVEGRVTGRATGRTVQLAIESAQAELGNGRRLALSEGSFEIPNTWLPRPPARIAFRSTGPVAALASLFQFPALRGFAPATLDPALYKGASDLRTVIKLPLADEVQPEEVVVQSTGALSNLAADTLLGQERLDQGNLTVSYDRAGLALKGEARIGGEKGQIEVRQNRNGQGEAVLTMALDNAARQKRGLGPEAGINGVVQLRVAKAMGKGGEAPAHVDLDLAKAALDGPIPGLSKAAGKPGKVSFSWAQSEGGPRLEDFSLDIGTTALKGRVELDRQNAFESARFSQFRVSPGDNLKVDVQRDGNLRKVTIRGAVMDARPFVRDLQAASGPAAAGAKPAESGADLDIDLDVPIVTGFNNETISNANLKLSRRGGDIRSLAFQGRIGRADVVARQGRQGEGGGALVVQSENGGSLLRFFDLYRRAHGGDLILNLGPGDARQSGELLFRNFVVRDEPALRRVLGTQPTLTPLPSGDRVGVPGPVAGVSADEAEFTKLRAEFTRSASRLDVSDMVIWGRQIGFTLRGTVDYGRDKVDIGGTFVPSYAFNNAFAQVPILGGLLGGGSQYGGLFAMNFRITGAASAPTMSVNPLSAIAPGILRRFVDPLGGSPNQRPIQPTPQR